ncbi:MAG: YcaO-like family protein, partial [Desulfovermiculus sp.]
DPLNSFMVRNQSRGRYALDWFRTINEFNGSSAGNAPVESVLQGLCELVERHVCARIDARQPELPTIDPDSLEDPTLLTLYKKFTRHGIQVWLKDFSLDFQVPTVGALAYDPSTFPQASEIVFTAGTATSPAKAAIRALTEVAQLAGDFESQSRYEPSGLSKYTSLDACHWVQQGPVMPLATLPDISHPDMARELSRLVQGIHEHGYTAYVVDTTHPELNIPAHYCVVPGFDFRERSPQASLGLFIGRMLAEQRPIHEADHGLHVLESLYPNAHFLPFFHGLLAMRQGCLEKAREAFAQAEPIQPTAQDQAFAAFYQAYCLSLDEAWEDIKPILTRAVDVAPDIHAVYNLRGVAYFKSGEYEQAVKDFRAALTLDPGSAMDLVNLGICLKRLGWVREAISCLQSGVELDPGLERAQSELEDLLAR